MNFIVIIWIITLTHTQARESVWTAEITEELNGKFYVFPNYLYKDSFITVMTICNSENKDLSINVVWMLVEMNCMQDMYNTKPVKQESLLSFLKADQLADAPTWQSDSLPYNVNYTTVKFQVSLFNVYQCGENRIVKLEDESDSWWYIAQVASGGTLQAERRGSNSSQDVRLWKVARNARKNSTQAKYVVTSTWDTGMYHFMFSVVPHVAAYPPEKFTTSTYVEMRSSYGYLPAISWPLLPYSAVTSFLYLLLGSVWIVVWVRAQEHATQIHMTIGIVTISGGIANTMVFIQQTSVNQTGKGFLGLDWVSLILAHIQNSLTSMLLMVVSTGHGITRPVLHKTLVIVIVLLASLGFLSSVGVMIVTDERLRVQYKVPIVSFLVSAFYGIMMLIIGAFIMVQSIMTAVHLWKRKHSQQIIFFCIFMAACIVSFIAEIFLLGIGYGWFSSCRQDWKHEWLFSNFGTLITLALLVVLMWLWRPVDVSKSYAFFPLNTHGDGDMNGLVNEDNEDEEETEIFSKANHVTA